MAEKGQEDAPSSTASVHHVELYKLAVEMADRVSARLGNTDAFLVTVNTGLLGFVSTV